MPAVTYNFSAGDIQRTVDAYCARFNYQDFVDDGLGNMIPNPESKTSFTKRIIREEIVAFVKQYEKEKAITEAAASVIVPNITPTDG